MLCSDTGCHEAVRYEHVDKKMLAKLNKQIGILKAAFRGNGSITVILSGGRVDDYKIATNDPPDKK